MQLGEVVFGGVGSGLYGMLIFAIIAVFIAGLMIGRTPEYLGKKIGPFEMKMAVLVLLVPPLAVLLRHRRRRPGTTASTAGVLNAGPHGFTEILYAFTSAGNNNGSAFAGYGANNVVLQHGRRHRDARRALLDHRADPGDRRLAGREAARARQPRHASRPTRPLFVGLLIGTSCIVGALTFFPALALGPIVEHSCSTPASSSDRHGPMTDQLPPTHTDPRARRRRDPRPDAADSPHGRDRRDEGAGGHPSWPRGASSHGRWCAPPSGSPS